jgi:chromosome segregation ATPase
MNIRTSLMLLATLLTLTGSVVAQELSREERREWQNIAREYRRNPEALRDLTEERDRYRQDYQDLQAQLSRLEAAQGEENTRLAQLEQENAQLRTELANAQETIRQLQIQQAQPEEVEPDMEGETGADYSVGVVYRVQVGAFRRNQIPAQLQELPDLTVEEESGMQKVLVGNYRDYADAQQRVAALKRQGFKSPWIVPYKDGRRVSLKEAQANQ